MWFSCYDPKVHDTHPYWGKINHCVLKVISSLQSVTILPFGLLSQVGCLPIVPEPCSQGGLTECSNFVSKIVKGSTVGWWKMVDTRWWGKFQFECHMTKLLQNLVKTIKLFRKLINKSCLCGQTLYFDKITNVVSDLARVFHCDHFTQINKCS